MRRPDRLGIVQGSLMVFALALIGKAGYEQLYHGRYWTSRGLREHYASSEMPAPRGEIEDANGNILAESRDLIHIGIAPREVNNRVQLATLMRKAHIDARWIDEARDTKRQWVDVPKLFLSADIAPVVALRGVHAQPAMDRFSDTTAGIRRIVGRVDPAGRPLDGMELALDNVLRGDTGSVRVARDQNGHALETVSDAAGPHRGNTVVLTINRNLQDICERALADAVDSLHATGGDIVVMNPHTGDLLAVASQRTDPRAVANTAVTEPYEPGSTVKPFVAAALLTLGRARPDEVIDTYGGHLVLPDGHQINDAEEHQAMMTLSEVIQHSSNVGIVRFGDRLTPREKYELFRDVGFGTPTTILLPAESPGTLQEPAHWEKSATSVLMGYEIAVTPLQVVTAYSAIANGGELLEPHIVKAIRSASGEVLYTEQRRVVRRVMAPAVAATIRQMLRDVVAGGTSTKADLQTIDVAGKSGTARQNVHGHYVETYTASFVGLFPDDNPQFVVLVKLDRPQNGYYGGIVAGGVTNVVLRAALAARDAALDLSQLASSMHEPRPDTSLAAREATRAKAVVDSVRLAAQPPQPVAPPVVADTDPRTSASYVVELPAARRVAPVAAAVRPVPDITGLPLRAAVRALHAAGFRVQIIPGAAMGTSPVAGAPWMPGRVVKLSTPE